MIYWRPSISSSELYHFGILGMRWGIRRYQNYDGSLTNAGRERYGVNVREVDKLARKGIRESSLVKKHTIPAGTIIYRTTTNENEDQSGMKYVSYAQADRNHYNGGWVRNVSGSDVAYENVYIAKEPLNVPSRKETYDVVNQVIKDNPGLLDKSAKAFFKELYPEGTMANLEFFQNASSKAEERKMVKDFTDQLLKDYKDYTTDQAAFWCMQTFGLNNDLKKKVVNELKSRGYNAMTDEASVGGQNHFAKEGIDPLIVFDANVSLDLKSTRSISKDEEDKALREYYRNFRNKTWNNKNSTGW